MFKNSLSLDVHANCKHTVEKNTLGIRDSVPY